MGRKIFVAVACWLALSRAEANSPVASAKWEDSAAEASLPRLYRSIPAGVYASASPYASFSFHVPAFATSPKVAHVGPIKQESVIVENKHGFLRDSYGNKFVQSPQSLPYGAAFPQQYVQLQELPAHLAQPLVAAAPSFGYKQLSHDFFGPPKFKVQAVQAVAQSPSNHYAINQPYEFGPIRALSPQQQQATNNVGKSQRLVDKPNAYNQHVHDPRSGPNNREKSAAIQQQPKSAVPLLDLSLLEPLTFENPLVPQVQHFLPRISSVTYHKLPQLNVDGVNAKVKEIMIQKTKTYDDDDIKNSPKLKPSRQQQQRPQSEDDDKRDEQDPPRDVPRDDSYEINSPNYQEKYNEKFVNYNKETESEPVHYSYNMKSEREPLSYNYVRTTKEPYREQPKNENQKADNNKDQNPKHLIYTFSPEESDEENSNYHNSQQRESEDSSEERSENKPPARLVQHNQEKSYSKEKHRHANPEYRDEEPRGKLERIVHKKEEHNHKPEKSGHHNAPHKHSQIETLSDDRPNTHNQPILHEHEENIRILPTPKKYASIKVDPTQHIQPQSHVPKENEGNPDDPPRNQPRDGQREFEPEQQVEEKGKTIIITEETPQEERPNSQELNDEADGRGEEKFGGGYRNAAYHFPSYESASKDAEKEIYNPQPYSPSRYTSDYDAEKIPFQRYVAESDEFPKSTRSNYKDARDTTKDKYYLDYAISKPESMLERLQQKEDYFKMYTHRKPQYLNDGDEGDKKKSAKYSAAPAIEYQASVQKPKQYFAKYKAAPRPQVYGYDYANNAPKDNSAYASGAYQKLKTYTQFVEPHVQYGFEPSVLPRLLDSELAAMATNLRPENEKPLMRKKVYKENWYIKKTSTKARKDNS